MQSLGDILAAALKEKEQKMKFANQTLPFTASTSDGIHATIVAYLDDSRMIGTVKNDSGIHAMIWDNDGYATSMLDSAFMDLKEVSDPTREAWEELGSGTRAMLIDYGKTEKVSAIKALRELTGLGLVESKRVIETFYP